MVKIQSCYVDTGSRYSLPVKRNILYIAWSKFKTVMLIHVVCIVSALKEHPVHCMVKIQSCYVDTRSMYSSRVKRNTLCNAWSKFKVVMLIQAVCIVPALKETPCVMHGQISKLLC